MAVAELSTVAYTTEEIAKIEAACRIVADTIAEVGKHVAPGVTTRELDAIAEDFIRTRNGIPAF